MRRVCIGGTRRVAPTASSTSRVQISRSVRSGLIVAIIRDMAVLRLILVPVDGSPPSLAALAHAVALVEDNEAQVDALRVEAPDEFSTGSTQAISLEARRTMNAALDAAIEQASAKLPGRISFRITSGEPLSTIIDVARDGRYDLVVLGTHGRIGRLHALFGSVAEGVVRNAPCPVLIVRDSSGGYQSFADRRHGRPSLVESPIPKPT